MKRTIYEEEIWCSGMCHRMEEEGSEGASSGRCFGVGIGKLHEESHLALLHAAEEWHRWRIGMLEEFLEDPSLQASSGGVKGQALRKMGSALGTCPLCCWVSDSVVVLGGSAKTLLSPFDPAT